MKILIVDDEPLARDELRLALQSEEDVEICGLCPNAVEAIKAINNGKIDVVFLDIQMPQISGFEMIAMIDPDKMPRIVFLTAHNEYAIRAFEEHAFDYLLKPLDPIRLAKTMERLRGNLAPEPADFLEETKHISVIPCIGISKIRLMRLDEVESVVSKQGGVFVVGIDGKENFTDLTLRTIEEKTPLIRCHRQYLVNLNQINEIKLAENGVAEILTRSNRFIPVSRRFLGALRNKIGLS
jgi:two-component system LytT family response regulator